MNLKRLFPLLCSTALLVACADTAEPPSSVEPLTESTAPATQEVLPLLREALPELTSFTIEEPFMQLGYNGFTRTVRQETARDGSFHFKTDSHQWNHASGDDFTQSVEYYYRYESDVLTYYYRIDDDPPDRGIVSAEGKAEMDASCQLLIGADALFPRYLENFTDAGKDTESGLQCYTFSLPVEKILTNSKDTKIGDYLSNVFYFGACSAETEFSGAAVQCTVWVSLQAMQPVRIQMDFAELRPYVLSESAQSGTLLWAGTLWN